MLESVERRFANRALPHPIEWLSDNGSCYRAHETISFAQSIGLVPRFTPVRSPQSNGMAESFVKTFKRDYVYVHDLRDEFVVLVICVDFVIFECLIDWLVRYGVLGDIF